jgi:hypothetical protein
MYQPPLSLSSLSVLSTVKEKSTDDSMLAVIDQIVDRESIKAAETIKLQMRLECQK